jgi:hypothetical protein
MAAPTFTALPTPPDRQDSPDTFSTDADAFVAALPTFQTDGNTIAAFCETKATAAEAAQAAAATSAATLSSTVTTHSTLSAFNADTPADGELIVLVIS